MNIEKGDVITPLVYQKICKTEHYMIKHQGFGISEKILEQLQREGINLIRIIYLGKTGIKTYISTLKQWQTSNKKHLYLEIDYQKFLSIKEMIEQ